jgi:hypothetical protein
MPNPLHVSAPGLGGKVNGFIEKSAREISEADSKRVAKKFPERAKREARRAQRETDR